MLLLNIVYGLVMAIATAIAFWFLGRPLSGNEWFAVFGAWAGGHIVYDYVAHQIVQYYNKDNVVTRDMYR